VGVSGDVVGGGWVCCASRIPSLVDRPGGAVGHPFAAPDGGGMVRCDKTRGVAVDEINQWGDHAEPARGS
jgi:hypothetical protein